jgi:dipeptidyl aminopeptidase/acylaminoacyl peptidase
MYHEGGFDRVGVLEGESLRLLHTPFDHFGFTLGTCGDQVFTTAGSGSKPMAVVRLDVDTEAVKVVKESLQIDLDPALISLPEAIEFPTTDDAIAHAFYYPPRNPGFAAPEGEDPPLLVLSHGGPTAATTPELDLSYQFWTSRGFALVDVNYRGSTGYGRDYRNALRGNWGVVDLDDCINASGVQRRLLCRCLLLRCG